MTWLNYDDVLRQLTGAGLLLKDGALEVNTAKPVRCAVEGDREKRGWYRLFELPVDAHGDRPAGTLITGSYGIWRGDDQGAIKIELPRAERRAVTAEQLAAMRARQRADADRAAAERNREIQSAAQRATRWWSQLAEGGPAPPYLVNKGLAGGNTVDGTPAGLFGARVSPAGNLVIPLHNAAGRIFGLQIIYSDPKVKARKGRDKDFTPPGLAKKGHWFQLGSPAASANILLVAEGFATAASLHLATGLPVAVAFDAGNLGPVADALKRHYRRARILIAADDDYIGKCVACGALTIVSANTCNTCGQAHGRKNTGTEAAALAALQVDGVWCAPTFPGPRRGEDGAAATRKGPTDWNDLHCHPAGGLTAVRTQIEAALDLAGWSVATPRRTYPAHGAGAPDTAGNGAGALEKQISIDAAFERYSLVYAGKATFFDHLEHCLVPKPDALDILPDHAWRDIKRMGGLPLVRLTEVGFDPGETDARITCNLWGGWPTVPKAGTCNALLNLLDHLCGHEKNARDIYNWVLKWLAYPIQHPGAKMRTALVIHGGQGVGKNLFFEAIMAIYSDYGRIIDQASLEDKFNDWASRKLFLIADEVVTRAELFHLKNKLKQFVTGEWIRINPKNVAAHDERNHVNVVFLSNERQPLVIERDDRRYVVIWTPEKLAKYHYEAVRDEIRAGGVAALHQYLLDLDLGDFDAYADPPMTTAKGDLIDMSLDSTDRFLRDWQSGDVTGRMEAGEPVVVPFCPCSSQDLYGQYKRWCTAEGVARPREQAAFLGHVAKLPGWTKGHRDVYAAENGAGATRRARMIVPGDAALTDALKRPGAVDYRRSEAETQAQWLTKCFFAFRNALPNAL